MGLLVGPSRLPLEALLRGMKNLACLQAKTKSDEARFKATYIFGSIHFLTFQAQHLEATYTQRQLYLEIIR